MTVTEDLVRRAQAHALHTPRPLRHVRVGVFGLARSGIQHAALLSTFAEVELTGIGDPDRDARRNAKGMGLGARTYAAFDTLLQRAKPDIVFLGAYPDAVTHAGRALDAGAAVQLEGCPLPAAPELEPLLARSRERERAVSLALPLRHHPVFQRARGVIAGGALGTIREVRASRTVSRVFNPVQQRAAVLSASSRGALSQVGAELVCLLIHMFGAPEEATATARTLYGPLDDELHGRWTAGARARVELEVSWSMPGYPKPSTVIEIEAERGRMLISEDAIELDMVTPGAYPAGVTRLSRGDMPQLARFEVDGDARWIEDATFLEWATGGAESDTALAATLGAARLTDALYASAATAGAAVKVAA